MKPRRGIGCELSVKLRYDPPSSPWWNKEKVLGVLGLLLIVSTPLVQEESKGCSGFGPPPGWEADQGTQ